MSEPDPLGILLALERHEVSYVVIGAQAAVVHGVPLLTEDLDITPAEDDENLRRLAAALRELGARLRSLSDPSGVEFPVEPGMLSSARTWTLVTDRGDLDIVFSPDGTGGYDDLRRDAVLLRVGEDLIVPVAALADVIRSKEAAGREKDRMQLPLMRRALEEIRARERAGRRDAR